MKQRGKEIVKEVKSRLEDLRRDLYSQIAPNKKEAKQFKSALRAICDAEIALYKLL